MTAPAACWRICPARALWWTASDTSDIAFEPPLIRESAVPETALLELPEGLTLAQRMEQLERELVESTLRRHRFESRRLHPVITERCSARAKFWARNDPAQNSR